MRQKAAVLVLGFLLCAATPLSSPTPSFQESLDTLKKAFEAGRYSEAETGARDLLARAEKAYGPESPQVCDVLDFLVDVRVSQGKARVPETREMAERAVGIARKVYGDETSSYARSLCSLGNVLLELNEFDQSRTCYVKALAIREKVLPTDDPDLATVLYGLANVEGKTGHYEKGRELDERAVAIWEKSGGPDSPKMALGQFGLGYMLRDLGDLAGAKTAWERALQIWEKNYSPDHPKAVAALKNLSNVLYLLGEMTRARQMRERVLVSWEKTFGPDHTYVAYALNNLGTSLLDAGDIAGARSLFERALASHEKNYGAEDLEVAVPLINLANVAFMMGDYAEARRLRERILSVREKALGPEHPEVAADLADLGVALMNLDDDPGAQALFERALAIQEKVLGTENADLARTLTDLAIIREDEKDYPAARMLYQRALNIQQKSLGAESPSVAFTLAALGGLSYLTGDGADAKRQYQQALAIREKMFGTDHSEVADILNRMAMLDWDAGDGTAALDLSLQAETILREQFQRTAPSLAEREALRFEISRVSGLSMALSALASATPSHPLPPRSIERTWNEVIRSRALVLDEMAARNVSMIAEPSPELRGLSQTLIASRDRLASLVVRGPDPEAPEGYREELMQARLEKEQAERQLAAKSSSLRRRLAKSGVGYAEVKAALPAGWALVAYVNYDRIFPYGAKERGSGSRRKPSTSYLAFTLGPSEQEPRVIRIGSAEEVEPLIEAWKREVATAPTGLRTAGSGAEERYRESAQRLRSVLWDPLAKSLKGAKKVFVVPDGAVNSVSLATLPVGRTGYLAGSGPLIHYLSSERDFVREEASTVPSKGVLAVGAPDFDAPPSQFALVGSPPSAETGSKGPSGNGYRSPRAACGTFQSLRFDPLPGAEEEVRELESIWSKSSGSKGGSGEAVEKLVGAAASEAAFKKRAPGHRVLHLATHGFFIQEQCESDLGNARAKAREAPGSAQAELPILGDSPLLLSGLALAGANRRNEVSLLSGEEDGVLTAEEVASLDLSGTQWAVLSACETGVGIVQAGEGVLGIRRAFEVAGAHTLIMSLWKVEDETSREWMRSLYEARQSGLDTATAVRKASVDMIRSRSSAGKSAHPFFWGAFVAAGDWK